MLVTQGVILQEKGQPIGHILSLSLSCLGLFWDCSPVAHRETHGVSDQNDRDHAITTDVLVGIDAVAHGQLATDGDGGGEHAHGEDETEPMDMVSRSGAPDQEPARNEDEQGTVQPQAVLGLHDAIVLSGLPEDEPVTDGTRVKGTYTVQLWYAVFVAKFDSPKKNTNQTRHIRQSHHAGREIVGRIC